MMIPKNFALRFKLWSQTREYEFRVRQAKLYISEWLTEVRNPYIAFSAGKDSTCVLHLIREQKPDTPAVYFCADSAFPEMETIFSQTPNFIRQKTRLPFLDMLTEYGGYGPRFAKAMLEETVYKPIEAIIQEYDFDGIAYGLRMAESYGRQMNFLSRGAVFQYKRDGLWACQPIVKWSYNDVWAYIMSNSISYCGTYDRMWDMPEDDQRICYWAGGTKRHYGRLAWLKRNYLGLFNRLAEIYPDVRSFV
jgi:3'-phosphoadenosine 5'-phosphosulfate sulfotransferase (PAPS reductase)/FAD synthetase